MSHLYINLSLLNFHLKKKLFQYVVINTKAWGENKKPYSVHSDFLHLADSMRDMVHLA